MTVSDDGIDDRGVMVRFGRGAIMLAVGVVAAGLLAGCGGGGGNSFFNGAIKVGGGGGTTAPAVPTAAASTQQGTGSSECGVADLTVTAGQPETGTVQVATPLLFTNKGHRTCTMRGFPKVTYVAGDDGRSVGGAAVHVGNDGSTVTLAPGEVASAMIHEPANTANYDDPQCQPDDVRGYRVYPPDGTAGAFIPNDHQVCTGASGAFLEVGAVTTGSTGDPGQSGAGATNPVGGGSASVDNTFIYVAGQQYVEADGASVRMYQAEPEVAPNDGHSLQELAVQSADSQQIVEVGWTVDRATDGDSAPHLFTFHWVNGQPSCYDTCGFVETAASAGRPGMPVPVGQEGEYAIQHFQGRWWVGYDNQWFGYYSDSLWNGSYTRAGRIQTFGEVAAAGPTTCTDMGDGQPGAASNASYITDFRLLGSTAAPALQTSATDSAHYSLGAVTPTSFRLGGPGTGPC